MFLELRKRLIEWLTRDDIIVIINTATYDTVLEANSKLFPSNCLFRSNKAVNLEAIIQAEVDQRLILLEQGVHKQDDAFVLDPFYKERLLS